MKNVFPPLTENVLVWLGWTVAASAIDAAIQKKMFWVRYDYVNNFKRRNGWYHENLLNLLNQLNILKNLVYWKKGVCQTIKKDSKEDKSRFFGMLIGTLCATLLGNMLVGKLVIQAGESSR